MSKIVFFIVIFFIFVFAKSQIIEHTYYFDEYSVTQNENGQIVRLNETYSFGYVGNPIMPYMPISILLPEGKIVDKVDFEFENKIIIPQKISLAPIQKTKPLSVVTNSIFEKNDKVYDSMSYVPSKYFSNVQTQFLNGCSFAAGRFTPARWTPSSGEFYFYSKVTIRIKTKPIEDVKYRAGNSELTPALKTKIMSFAQNKNVINSYSVENIRAKYDYLIITSTLLKEGFDTLKLFYDGIGISTQIRTIEEIKVSADGRDLAEKVRNFIKQEYVENSIEYVLLGGDTNIVPMRAFYCKVVSGEGYESYEIPADLYFCALDGNFDNNANNVFGEAVGDSCDLLPEVALGRFPVETMEEVANMVNKSITYQKNPIISDINHFLLIGESVSTTPLTMGQDYLRQLIDFRDENGYATYGLPSLNSKIDSLFDKYNSESGSFVKWNKVDMMNLINKGSSLIFHVGHSFYNYMMRMYLNDFDENTFANLDGITHSYGILYSHGCTCGAFDYDDCIAEKAVLMKNFLVAAIVNSRYGWFNEGQTEGPSQHLNREFLNALYNSEFKTDKIGVAFMQSKIRTAPWVDLVGEYEFGAQRWVHYDNNLLGDPAMKIWLTHECIGLDSQNKIYIYVYPNPTQGEIFISGVNAKNIAIFNLIGNLVYKADVDNNFIYIPPIASGKYFMQIIDDKNEIFGKSIIVLKN